MSNRTTFRAVRAPLVIGLVLIVAACGSGDLLSAFELFGPTVERASALDATDAPLESVEIARLLTELPVTLVADPIDL